MERLTNFKNSLSSDAIDDIIKGKMELPNWLVAVFEAGICVLWDYENDYSLPV